MVADDLAASSSGVEGVSQTERVVVTLRGMVLRGDFRPGERLAELSLVSVLNASRTPVRLALERLSHQGLLEASPSGGFRVREFTVADIGMPSKFAACWKERRRGSRRSACPDSTI